MDDEIYVEIEAIKQGSLAIASVKTAAARLRVLAFLVDKYAGAETATGLWNLAGRASREPHPTPEPSDG